MFKDRFRLLTGNAWKPLEELFHSGAGLQIFEERRNRHTGAPEDPGTTHPVRGTFDSGALRPVEHRAYRMRIVTLRLRLLSTEPPQLYSTNDSEEV